MKLNEPRWYVVQTYSGQENAVKKDLERRIDSMGVTDFVFEVMVPEETIIEKKDGKEKEKSCTIISRVCFCEYGL